jgi:UDP-N-acetyl-D-glucosamine dehydrogenase
MKNLNICIIGLGYVGLPLALNFARKDLLTTGLDVNKLLINDLKKNISRITSVKNKELKNIANKNKLSFSYEYTEVAKSTHIIICVPTPLKKDKPDLSYVISTCNSLVEHIKKGQTIIFESTSYPGTTRNVISKILSKGKLKAEKDFFICFSPERENPGMTSILYKDIPKVISAISSKGLVNIKKLYGIVFKTLVVADTVEEAEAAKLLENCFRAVNIAFINELRDFFYKQKIDIWNVIKVAKTKPFGFMPFYPSIGAGGHCIPIDPKYLTWYARKNKGKLSILENSLTINKKTPLKVFAFIKDIINEKKIINPKIKLYGITYKKNVNDSRESSSLKLFKYLDNEYNNLDFYDPYIDKITIKNKSVKRAKTQYEKNSKLISIIGVNHDSINYKKILSNSKIVIDLSNVYKTIKNKKIILI